MDRTLRTLITEATDSFADFKVLQAEHKFGLATCEDLSFAHARAREAKRRLYEAMGWGQA